ncbi:uncharacterized protein FA14DRAFT_158852 [Meira miltonrushii]|uniref:PAS domain-containing protein n=1 Tax=Meira miltonrushii TaxID=1280837 RepID=A0A316V176_9BASI|nr:uncharacterized protein FA14DRAFT_158852 [Meira miltonrushii]PWN31306.1 hypothetical protein FA14DRAFT_158852 [Meira miltonrushii]
MGSRHSDFQRQRSALLLIDPPPRSNNDPSPRQDDAFISPSSFPVFEPIFSFDIMQQSNHTNTQRSTAQQERIHFSKAKPHCQILTPFPLWLDKRFIDQEKADLTEKHKSKQKTPSEDVRCSSTRLSEGQDRFDVATFAFLHFDPTLEESLGYSVDSLIGTSILDFMHPNEATEIGLKILHVSMYMKSVASLGSDQQLTDIPLELIGDDMLLCFFHAVEKRSIHDDQREKSQWLSQKHFQILTNGTTSSKILFSWPPPRLFDLASYHSDSSGTESYNDGSYFADDLARSAIETKIGEENLGMNQFVTACTRQQIIEGKITADGVSIEFIVTLIPRGDIKFAIFSISRAEHINQEAGHSSSRGDQIFPVLTPNHQSQPSTIANPEQQKQSSFSQTPPDLTFSKSIFSFPSMAAAPSAFTSQTPQTFNIMPATGMMVDDEMREPGRRLSARVKTITSQDPFRFPMNDDKL